MGKPEKTIHLYGFSGSSPLPHITARQNLQLVPEVNDPPSIEEMTAQLRVDNCGLDPCPPLSWTTPTSIIRALRKPFRLLLLDEPFSHLDEENQKHASIDSRSYGSHRCRLNSLSLVHLRPFLWSTNFLWSPLLTNLPCKLAFKWQVQRIDYCIPGLPDRNYLLYCPTILSDAQSYWENEGPKNYSINKSGRRSFGKLGQKDDSFSKEELDTIRNLDGSNELRFTRNQFPLTHISGQLVRLAREQPKTVCSSNPFPMNSRLHSRWIGRKTPRLFRSWYPVLPRPMEFRPRSLPSGISIPPRKLQRVCH